MFSFKFTKLTATAFALGLILWLLYCSTPVKQPTYANHAQGVQYVGMQTCQSCHANIHQSFVHTGMGRSFDLATPAKSQATYGDHALVYDENTDFYYFPYWQDSSLWIKEFRLEKGDTVHLRTERIDYIVGSGQHTNSHLLSINGYLFQAPITYYTQDGRWDMAPGFDNGENLRFGRVLTSECITCHNHFPKQIEGSLNKYQDMPSGIECERCHGPGEVHVREKLAGNLVDTSKEIDYTIVNPRDLPRDLQMDLCQRCHLQGVTVLKEGKTFYDFKPGFRLVDYMNVFLPRYDNSHERFIMASQADRLRLSACYERSDMTCITCHNPHEGVTATEKESYNAACASCHSFDEGKGCSTPETELSAAQNDCISCHMPKSGSVDIPHVRITDHYIQKHSPPQKTATTNLGANPNFLGLKILTKEKGTALEMAEGYLACYDKYIPDPIMLDSAVFYLEQSTQPLSETYRSWIHYYFNREAYTQIVQLTAQLDTATIRDGWTNYRIGEAFFKNNAPTIAWQFYRKAVGEMPFNLDFQEKLGITELYRKDLVAAKRTFDFVLQENPKRPMAQLNRGYLFALEGQLEIAEHHYDRAIQLDPDYAQAYLNKAAIRLAEKDRESTVQLLRKVLELQPDNSEARNRLQQLQAFN